MFYAGCISIGLAAGFLSALLGIGGGVVVVPMLLILLGADMKVAVGTSLACIVPIALAGVFLKHAGGQVDWKIVLCVVPLGILGVYLGDKVSDVSSGILLKRIFGAVMLMVAVQMMLFPCGWEGLLYRRQAHGRESAPPAATESRDTGGGRGLEQGTGRSAPD